MSNETTNNVKSFIVYLKLWFDQFVPVKNVLEVVLVCSFGFVLIVSLSTYFDNRGDKPHTHDSETRFIKIWFNYIWLDYVSYGPLFLLVIRALYRLQSYSNLSISWITRYTIISLTTCQVGSNYGGAYNFERMLSLLWAEYAPSLSFFGVDFVLWLLNMIYCKMMFRWLVRTRTKITRNGPIWNSYIKNVGVACHVTTWPSIPRQLLPPNVPWCSPSSSWTWDDAFNGLPLGSLVSSTKILPSLCQ